MRQTVQKWRAKFAIWFWNRLDSNLIGACFKDTDEKQWLAVQESEFVKAKWLSDCVAMILRLAFLFGCFGYFSRVAPKAEWWLERYALGMCAFFALLLYAALFWRVLGILAAHFMKDTANWKSKWGKLITASFAMFSWGAVNWGITKLVLQIGGALSNLR